MLKYLLSIMSFIIGLIIGFILGFKINNDTIVALYNSLLSNPVLYTFAGIIFGSILTLGYNYFVDKKKEKHKQQYTISFIIFSLNHSFKYISKLYNYILEDLNNQSSSKLDTIELFSNIDKNDLVQFDGILNKNAFLDFNLYMRQLEHLKNKINNFIIDNPPYFSDFSSAFFSSLSQFSDKIKHANKNQTQYEIKDSKTYNLYSELFKTFFELQKSLIEIIVAIDNSKIELDVKTRQFYQELKSYSEFIDKSFS